VNGTSIQVKSSLITRAFFFHVKSPSGLVEIPKGIREYVVTAVCCC